MSDTWLVSNLRNLYNDMAGGPSYAGLFKQAADAMLNCQWQVFQIDEGTMTRQNLI